MKEFVLALLAAGCIAVPAHAAIICAIPTSTTEGSLTVTAPITFSITTAGTAATFVLDEWVKSDGTGNYPTLSPNLAIAINGVASSRFSFFVDNPDTNGAFGEVTANDGFFLFNPGVSLAVGNTLTLLAGTYIVQASTGFNPQAAQTFTGNMFVTDNNGVRLSNIVSAVPEPSTWVLLGLGAVGAGVVALRRRQRVA